MRQVERHGNIAESLEGEVTLDPDWLGEHVGVLPEDRMRIDPEVWSQLAGFIERREAVRAGYQIFSGRVSTYELHPYHLLACHGERCSPRGVCGSGSRRNCGMACALNNVTIRRRA